jgi:hypothetical protein
VQRYEKAAVFAWVEMIKKLKIIELFVKKHGDLKKLT